MFKLLAKFQPQLKSCLSKADLFVKPADRHFSISAFALHNAQPVRIIDDLNKPNDKKTLDEQERCKLAAVYRLVNLKGWGWSIYNHITIRSHENPDHFLINPYGLLYSEMTAANLVKIDSKCNVIETGTTTCGVNKAGFTLHSTMHEARTDVNAILHVHTGLAAGLSALKCGLLPISQEAFICGHVSYHDYAGILVDDNMRKKIVADLGARNKILILRNHGVAFCGTSIEEVWFWLSTFMTAADIQMRALAASNGIANLTIPGDDVLKQVQRVLQSGSISEAASDGIKWKLGEQELEAEMRHLDYLGYKTGYNYKKPSLIQ